MSMTLVLQQISDSKMLRQQNADNSQQKMQTIFSDSKMQTILSKKCRQYSQTAKCRQQKLQNAEKLINNEAKTYTFRGSAYSS